MSGFSFFINPKINVMKLKKTKIKKLELDELKNISGGRNIVNPISTRDTLSYTNTARAMSETELDVEYE